MHNGRRNRRVAACLVLLLGALGCSDSKVGRVTGTVTIDGRPAPDLEIEFNPVAGGRGSIGGTDANGKYSMQYTLQQAGALTGEHQVIIRGRPGADLDYSVPARYGLSGDQRFEVKPGSNECNIDMVSDAGN